MQWDSSESDCSEADDSNELRAAVRPEISVMDTVDSASKRQATRVFKKSNLNGKITVYLGKRDFVDHITHVDPIGNICQTSKRVPFAISLLLETTLDTLDTLVPFTTAVQAKELENTVYSIPVSSIKVAQSQPPDRWLLNRYRRGRAD